ncbi:MAG: enoyl-CoA hydratase/isomerase family protein [Alphaproteobacteria bacterium]|jgi:enoyl-CoA hydratase/carnithine racemase|nr:enoyl-CoA hydratase [Rhodospirillaceae bacterium]MDP6020546.1 enoyl-CoA hydratase/isomerase family protein [Alphaproteobacteria bacterium]MDP6257171.1 enoyl-CoA hydratase/isomerase family protein [Alphaproteobacteria bacterium]MDP7052633.1 enoyl-CoA hydratase/isomerase family protein [Alphaproteobacteria bacterium]MDP7229750.1 enoyl-CoA hydratase/isomerase family protein [Alphaproteobacteria bacterium]|tara:strand:- start:417 stop:1157 length:741 start_codon:yes stop_codon:yes gene_type:complete
MTELVLRSDKDGVVTLTLNRPDALNALSPNLFVELRGHVESIAGDPENVGCVVLRGAGRSFCAGNDLKAIQNGEEAPSPTFQSDTINMIENLPQPVIAEIRGHCYTGGLELALSCDLLVASETAKFADTHGKWGMTPRWGMSQRLPRRIGPLKAKEMSFTARTYSGAEAAAMGLANHCVADDQLEDVVGAVAADIVANSWHSARGNKMLYNKGQDYTFHDGLAFEMAESPGRGPDIEERLKAFSKS